MNDRVFLDTNILVYANDCTNKEKQTAARQIVIDGILNENIAVSTQVLGEFYVVATRKSDIHLSQKSALRQIQMLRTVGVDIDFNTVVHAILLSEQHKLSYWDALIIASVKKQYALLC